MLRNHCNPRLCWYNPNLLYMSPRCAWSYPRKSVRLRKYFIRSIIMNIIGHIKPYRATCSRWSYFSRGVGLDNLQRSLPTPTSLCGSVNLQNTALSKKKIQGIASFPSFSSQEQPLSSPWSSLSPVPPLTRLWHKEFHLNFHSWFQYYILPARLHL